MSQTAVQNRQTAADVGSDVELREVYKFYGSEPAVKGVDLNIRRGEFFSILGPSGCGKTTMLRMIAGFEVPSGGEVLIQGRSMNNVPPYRRPVNTVFQSYALFNHLTVSENVAFGLRLKKRNNPEIQSRVNEALQLVKMEKLANRLPSQLSGGQQQRVALARALVNRPAVLLLDEPLGALDFKLRKEMQIELATLHQELELTFVMVTHDQEEALSLSDRIGVMNQGKLEQVDTPNLIYDQPQTPFVADFIGDTNLFNGKVEGYHPNMLWVTTDRGLKMTVKSANSGTSPTSGQVVVSVRPENIQMSFTKPTDSQVNWYEGRLRNVMYLGTHIHYQVELQSGDRLTVRHPNTTNIVSSPDTPVYLQWTYGDCLALPAENV
jgi:spermidine/putrescine transport system ATP-binding protein